MWKTEAEFQAIFQGEETKLAYIEAEFIELKKYLNALGLPFIINEKALQAGEAEIRRIQRKMQSADEGKKERWKATLDNNKVHIRWLKVFK